MRYKIIITIAVLSIVSSNSNAQLIRTYGIKIGIIEASQDWTYAGGSTGVGSNIYDKSRIGLNVGGYVEWLNLPFVSLVTELNYTQKGSKYEFEITTVENPGGTGEMRSFTPRIDYLSIPLLAKLRFETPVVAFYGIVGPRMDYIIGHNEYASSAVFTDLKSPEFGVTAGAGFDFPILVSYKVGGEFRYSYSPQYAFSGPNLKVKNNSTEFLVTIGF